MPSQHTIERTFTQALSSGALFQEYEFLEQSRIIAVYMNFSVSITETVVITRVPIAGAEYSVRLNRKVLDDTTDYIFHPEWDVILIKGDIIRIECTNANSTGTIYGILHIEGGIR